MPSRHDPAPLFEGAGRAVVGPGSGDPIYIGGLDRSGKTTMAAFLASHPNVAIPAVGSNMWTYFYRQYGDLRDDANLDRCLDAMSRYKHVVFLKPDFDQIRVRFLAGERTYAQLFGLFLRQYAEREGKPRWGAQTGLIERYAPELFRSYGGLRVVHMVRDPRDRYEASLALWPDGKGRAGGAVARWNYSNRLARANERRWPDRYRVVRFEDLIRDTEATLRSVCEFLEEDFRPEMLEMRGAPRHRDRLLSSDGGDELLSDSYIGLHRDRIDGFERAFIDLHAGRGMAERGYRRDPIQFSAGQWVRFIFGVWPDQTARMVAWRVAESLQQHLPGLVGRKPGRRMIVEPAA